MKNKDRIHFIHMLDYSKEAVDISKNRIQKDLETDRSFFFTITRLLEIIGEAANKIDHSYQDKFPQIPWRKIINMRNRLVHEYFDIEYRIIWNTIKVELPILIENLENILSSTKTN